MNSSILGRSLLVVALTTGLFFLAGLFLHEPVVLFAYPNVIYESLDQYFWHKLVTAIAFSVLGLSLGIYYWFSYRKSPPPGYMRTLLIPMVSAVLLSFLGLLYYRHEYSQIAATSGADGHAVSLMIDAVNIHYIPLAVSLMVSLAIGITLIKNRANTLRKLSHK